MRLDCRNTSGVSSRSDRFPVRARRDLHRRNADHRDVAAVHFQRLCGPAGLPQRRRALPLRPRPGGTGPGKLGHTHAKHLSPHTGSLSQSILALVVVLIFVITGQDPVLALFTWLTQLGTLAIIVLMALASFAVVAFFARNRDLINALRTTVAPIVGGVAMTAVAIYAASQFGLLIGNPESPLRWILPALIVVAAIGGTSQRSP